MDPPQPPSSSRVLLTVELAEQILSNLPFQDLVHAELVCRTWHSIIHWSPHVRQGLFLEPSPHALSMAYQSNTKLRKPWQWRTLNVKRYIETYTIAILHPYLESEKGKERRGMIAFTFDWERAMKLRREGRWRRMFVTQPPCRNVKIEFLVGVPGAIYTGRDRVSDPQGVRLGLMVDRMRELLAHPAAHGELQPMPTAVLPHRGEGEEELPSAWFERLDCYVDGFISEAAAFALASKAAAAGVAAAAADGAGSGSGSGGRAAAVESQDRHTWFR